jgi:trehalose 6-phosphate synthase/phosphatase
MIPKSYSCLLVIICILKFNLLIFNRIISREHSMGRWIIVSNRLPFSYDQKKNKLTPSSGGLVTAIRGIKTKNPVTWVGSVPDNIPRNLITRQKDKGISYSFPDIPADLYDTYYNGFCNDVLWPLLHYESELVKYKTANWESYKKVNQIFADHIIKLAKKGDVIWIHDFHLFLVPQMVKEKKPNVKIGFFLHVPFPSSEIYRQLPCRDEIVSALIHADLIGFHDFSYLRHFCSSVYNLLGISNSMLEIRNGNHTCKLGVYPVSIDTKSFMQKAVANKTKEHIQKYQLNKKSMDIILGVDRLDYIKGIQYKLRSFRQLLEDHPEYIGKVQLIQVAVPSRTEVTEYINLRQEVEKLVGEINGKYSTLDYIPIKYIFKSIDIYKLMALYRSSKVLFITSKRDGMNLVSLEYIATQNERNPGVVLLSEFAGAASTLSHALQINPMNIIQSTKKLKQALEMPLPERKFRHKIMLNFLQDYTATDWAKSFINHLENKTIETNRRSIDLASKTSRKKLVGEFKDKKKVLLLDYDGTLVPIANTPEEAVLSEKYRNQLKKWANYKDVEIVVVSGRPVTFLKKQLKGVPVYLAGEHGGKFYDYKRDKWRSLVSSNKKGWYQQALDIIKTYTKRTPNSFFEKKNFAITWHFRNSPTDFAEFQARKLVVDLETGLQHLPVSVITGKKVVEVKAIEANKGYFANWFMDRYIKGQTSIMAIGDDRTDEDMFNALKNRGHTIKVGSSPDTQAHYLLNEQTQVFPFLKDVFGEK